MATVLVEVEVPDNFHDLGPVRGMDPIPGMLYVCHSWLPGAGWALTLKGNRRAIRKMAAFLTEKGWDDVSKAILNDLKEATT